MPFTYSNFATSVTEEGAFGVLAVAKRLKALGKDVIELEIGDSPFPSPRAAKAAAIDAINRDLSHYCPSAGIPEFRAAAAEFVRREFKLDVDASCIVVGGGAKIFEPLFCQAFLNPGDGVLVFSPYFPTYVPNITSRGARAVFADLKQARHFRPDPRDVESFLKTDPQPRAIFLNSPHNPTGGVALEEDLREIADLIRGRDIALFSDEPYCHMVWQGEHRSPLALPGMLDQCVGAYTFSKSYSMSGWRLGFSVSSPQTAEILARLVNISLSCVPPVVQWAGIAALRDGNAERDQAMADFRGKVEMLARELEKIDGVHCLPGAGAFYVFPSVADVCNRLGITSQGLALYLLEGADERLGVACLGGECFGAAGAGFLRFSCAEPNERLEQAVKFIADAFQRRERVAAYLATRPAYRLAKPY